MAQGMTRSVERARAGYEALLQAQTAEHQAQREEHAAITRGLDELNTTVARQATLLEAQAQRGRLSMLLDKLSEQPVALTAALAFAAFALWIVALGLGLPVGSISTPIGSIEHAETETSP